jgi:penicillin-binding protein 1B
MARLRRWFVVAMLLAAAGLAAGVMALDARVRAYIAGPALGGARVYAAPVVLRPGEPVAGGSLTRLLNKTGFQPAREAQLSMGEYRVGRAEVEFVQRTSPAPWAQPPRHVRVALGKSRVDAIRDVSTGAPLDALELEPELVAVLGASGTAVEAGDEQVPSMCRRAVLAAEDRNFFRHPGVDPLAIVRALIVDLRAGTTVQGGSTLTQQLVKNAFLTPHRTLRRKVQEAILAVLLEVRMAKKDILDRYLSSVYLGSEGGLPVHGFARGADVYFGKPLAELGPGECATLAGMIRGPNRLSPRRHPKAALARRNQVLAAMVEEGWLDEKEERATAGKQIVVAPLRPRGASALYVAAEVGRTLERVLPADVAEAPGLSVFTTIDAEAQRQAERAVRKGIDALERGRKGKEPLQAALIAIDPTTGGIRALVGGRDYASSPLDRAIRSRRQPGSAFKPFVYLAALDPTRSGPVPARTVVSQVEDSPLSVRVGKDLWEPANYDETYAGMMPVEDALADSRNTAAVRVALDVGLDAVAQSAADLGLTGTLPRVPALALGVSETSLVELTSAYAVFASGGMLRPATLVSAVTSSSGETLYAATRSERRVLTPGMAYLMTHLLERVVDVGTGRGAREAGLAGPAAGKTGTTDQERDAWFVGYTADVVAGVWVGLDGNSRLGMTGARAALPIWTDFVKSSTRPDPDRRFPVPEDIVWRDVDPASGELATGYCPQERRVPFLVGTEPDTQCRLHRPTWQDVGDEVDEAVREGGRAVQGGARRLRDWFGRIFR